MPLVVTYNRSILNDERLTKTLKKFSEITNPSTEMKKTFKEIIGTHRQKIEEAKKIASLQTKCTPHRSTTGNICSKQVKTTTSFQSQQTNKTWRMFHKNASCKTDYAINLVECTICSLQYFGQNEKITRKSKKTYRQYQQINTF